MPDYSQGKIYTIRSYLTDDVYYGSTCQKLSDRLSGHKLSYKRWLKNKVLNNISSYRIFEKDIDAYIELVELYPCNSKIELHKKEGEIIRQNTCVNKCIAGRTVKEYQKQHYENNKEQRLENQKQHYQNNIEQIAEYQKQYYENNKEQLLEKMKQHYENNKEHIAEQMKQYQEDNKEQIAERMKRYIQDNKALIAEKRKVKYTCDCGSILSKSNKSTHEKTKKHQTFISQ